MINGLEADDRRDAGREELGERTHRVDCDPVAHCRRSSMNADDHADRAEQPELLTDRGEDEVGGGVRDLVGVPEPEPRTREPAGAERVPRLDDLEARVRRVAATG